MLTLATNYDSLWPIFLIGFLLIELPLVLIFAFGGAWALGRASQWLWNRPLGLWVSYPVVLVCGMSVAAAGCLLSISAGSVKISVEGYLAVLTPGAILLLLAAWELWRKLKPDQAATATTLGIALLLGAVCAGIGPAVYVFLGS